MFSCSWNYWKSFTFQVLKFIIKNGRRIHNTCKYISTFYEASSDILTKCFFGKQEKNILLLTIALGSLRVPEDVSIYYGCSVLQFSKLGIWSPVAVKSGVKFEVK